MSQNNETDNPDQKTQQQKLGKTMLGICWIIVLIGLTFAFGNWEEKQYNPNQSLTGSETGTFKELVLQANRKNHYILSGKINGKEVTFLLDTGATDVAVPAHLGEKLNLKPGFRSKAITANGIVEVRDTNIRQLDIGNIQLFDVNASLNPGMQGNEILLGMSALKQLEFIQRGNQLTLRHYF